MDNAQITLTILSGTHGGLIVYETIEGEQHLVFGGDHEAATKYLATRMANLSSEPQEGEPQERKFARRIYDATTLKTARAWERPNVASVVADLVRHEVVE